LKLRLRLRLRLRLVGVVVLALVGAVLGAVGLGGTSSAVYGGRYVNNDRFPWVVQLRWANGVGCSGSLIRPDAVLTAAHCLAVGAGRSQAVFFPYTHPQAVATKGGTFPTSATSKYGGFEGVNSCTARDDIAVMFLRKSVSIRTVPLSFAAVGVGGSTTAYGFGADSRPAHVQVAKCRGQFPPEPPIHFPNALKASTGTVISTSTCSSMDPPGDSFTYAPETQYCINNGQSSTNHGDSGGPVLSSGAVAGVVSGGLGGPPWINAVTSVAAEAEWLRSTLSGHPQAAVQGQPLTASALSALSTRRVATKGGSLRVHGGPALSAPVVGSAAAGSTVSVACQTGGFDRLASGGYVSDAFVAGSGRVPACTTASAASGDEPLITIVRGA
jgi:trypsin